MRSSDACDAIPDGIDGIEAGSACPHNVYIQKASVFANRDGVMETVDRLFRLVNAADVGILIESELDSLTTTELIVAKGELNRQESEKSKKEYEIAQAESEKNRRSS